jgi:hypothetical protein
MIKRFRVPDLLANHGPTFIERIGPALRSRRGDWAEIETTHPQYRAEVDRRYVDADPSVAAKAVNLAKSAAGAATSAAKTAIGIDVVADEVFAERYETCRNCPSGNVRMKNGEPYTCGPMLESAMNRDGKTCGCVIRIKARDKKQSCPSGHWKR